MVMRDADARLQQAARWVLPALIAVTATVIAVLHAIAPDQAPDLSFDRHLILDGAWWRLVTGHLEHLGPGHAAFDVAALLVVAWIFGRDLEPSTQVALVGIGVVTIDAALWFLHPGLIRYAGLSGLAHAWFAAGATIWLLDRSPAHRRWGFALLAGLASKLILEVLGVAWWNDGLGIAIVSAAHRWGAFGGVVAALLGVRWRRWPTRARLRSMR